MSLITPPLLLVFLLMNPGVYGQYGWDVSYSPSHICTLKGSTVTMSCTYTYPPGYQIMKVFWTKTDIKEKHEEFPDLFDDPEYSQRLQYLGDIQQNCSIRLSHVTQKDEHMYYFRFITDKPDGNWLGRQGVNLTVTDLQVESPERVTEGDSVRLTCKSSCTLTDRATFIWYRNSQPLTERRDRNNQLLLQSVRREDAGRYSCALHGHNHYLSSPDLQLSVRYPLVNPVISISPSGEIVEGDSVTLNCSSDSNPPAEISWFKGGMFVGSGRIYSISNISSDHSGEYKCKSRNKHGEKYSDTVTLNIMLHHGLGWPVWLGITVACAGLFIIIIIIVFIMRKRRGAKAEDATAKQDDLYSNVAEREVSESAVYDDAPYASISSSKPRRDGDRDAEEIQYATVQHHKTKPTKRAEENENQYGNIRIHQPGAAMRRSDVETVEEASVIYSHVK